MSAGLRAQWKALIARIDALSRRERLMVLAASLVLVGFVGDTLLLAPQRAQRVQAERDTVRERDELAKLDAQLAELQRKLAADPDEVPKLRLRQLEAELSELNAGFQRLERSLVPPDQMARLLEQVMQRTPGITVVSLQSLAPRSLPEREGDAQVAGGAPAPAAPAANAAAAASPVPPAPAAGTTADAAAGGAPAGPALWRHGVELTVRGSYADLLRYVEAIERLPVKVYFARAVLDATRWPDVDLRLTVHTLGMDRAWLAL